jgi:prepilin-type N-terminal cleavage/methylation domain-containing protein
MNTTLKRFARLVHAGFTLVELLIVVIILAILAAIVIPQFASSTTDAQESALDANLAALRSAIELFKVQHNNVYPAGVAATGAGTPACTGTVGAGAITTADAWMSHLLMASDVYGHTCTVSDNTYRFGPYLRKGIPAEPIYSKGSVAADITITAVGTPIVPGTAGGWAFDTKSGQLIMNSSNADSKGKTYAVH